MGAGAPSATPAAGRGDPEQSQQWGLATIGAPGRPGRWAPGRGVIIGIVDTGVDLNHADLPGRSWPPPTASAPAGGDRVPTGAGVGQDDNGHGTHVAGIAAAVTGNGMGVAGVAPDAKLVVAKALDASSGGNVDDISAAVKWTVSKGAKVVNLSIASGSSAPPGRRRHACVDGIDVRLGPRGRRGPRRRQHELPRSGRPDYGDVRPSWWAPPGTTAG